LEQACRFGQGEPGGGGDGGNQGAQGDRGGHQTGTPTISQVLDGHVTLDLDCLDRIYLNG
jgi:hypothetical protein